MRFLLGLLVIFVLILLLLIGFGIGLGFLLHWLVPPIDVSIGTLIGVVALGLALQLLGRFLSLGAWSPEEDIEPAPPAPTTYVIEPLAPPRRRPRKRS